MIRRYLARILGAESIYPDAAHASVTACIAEYARAERATEETDRFLRVSDAIEHCATVATDTILAHSPGLDREGIRRAMSQELWLAMRDVADLSRSGAMLS